MTDDDYEALKVRIEALFDYWQPRLGLKWWSITLQFVRDASEFRVDDNPKPEGVAVCNADWRYLHATLGFNMLKCMTLDEEDLEMMVVHEMCHILTNETRGPNLKGYTAHEERVVSTLAKAFLWTRDMTRDEASE